MMTETTDRIEIALSKKKLLMVLLLSVFFTGIGIWFIIQPEEFVNPLFKSLTFIKTAGFASVVLFSTFGFITILKLLDKKPGLILNREGIIDNSSGVSAGLISWKNIEEIKTVQVMNQNFIMIQVNNPEEVLNRVNNRWKRKTMQMNYKNYGSPVTISANTLDISTEDLNRLLADELGKYQ